MPYIFLILNGFRLAFYIVCLIKKPNRVLLMEQSKVYLLNSYFAHFTRYIIFNKEVQDYFRKLHKMHTVWKSPSRNQVYVGDGLPSILHNNVAFCPLSPLKSCGFSNHLGASENNQEYEKH